MSVTARFVGRGECAGEGARRRLTVRERYRQQLAAMGMHDTRLGYSAADRTVMWAERLGRTCAGALPYA